MSAFQNWDDFSVWLDSLGMFHMELGLERVKKAFKRLGFSKPNFPVIQVLGTNGKGSTATFISSLAFTHGLRTGLFLSPHFLSIEERIKINGKAIPKAEWLDCANLIIASLQSDEKLTFFEFLTVLAVLIFSRAKVDLAVFEAGLGGKNDATSAIAAAYHCFCPIAMDHAAIIGPRLENIAEDKASAIQPGSAVFSAKQAPPVQKIIAYHSQTKMARLKYVTQESPHSSMRLNGDTQKINSSLALALWRDYALSNGIQTYSSKEVEALAKAFIPGRFQKIAGNGQHPSLILDGAHNPHAIQALIKNLNGHKPCAIIFSALADKDWQSSLDLLDKALGKIPMFIPELDNSRAAAPELVAAWRNRHYPNFSSCFYGKDGFSAALHEAGEVCKKNEGELLLAGSLYLLADFFKLYPQYLEASENF